MVPCVKNEFGEFLKFEPITMCHFDTSVIDVSLLDKWEVDWINMYNRRVLDNIGPFLEEDERHWLEFKTEKV